MTIDDTLPELTPLEAMLAAVFAATSITQAVAARDASRFRADLPPLTEAELDVYVESGRLPCDCDDCLGR